MTAKNKNANDNPTDAITVGARVSIALNERIDEMAKAMEHEMGMNISKSNIVQMCIEKHLPALEAIHAEALEAVKAKAKKKIAAAA